MFSNSIETPDGIGTPIRENPISVPFDINQEVRALVENKELADRLDIRVLTFKEEIDQASMVELIVGSSDVPHLEFPEDPR